MDRPYGGSDYSEMNRRASASVTDVSNVAAVHQSARMCSVCQRRDVSTESRIEMADNGPQSRWERRTMNTRPSSLDVAAIARDAPLVSSRVLPACASVGKDGWGARRFFLFSFPLRPSYAARLH